MYKEYSDLYEESLTGKKLNKNQKLKMKVSVLVPALASLVGLSVL